MWYTVESGKSTIRNEGELGSKLTYKNLREVYRLPSFDVVALGLAGDFAGLMEWSQDAHVRVLPFTLEKDKRIELELVLKTEDVVSGSVSYGTSKTLNAAFSRDGDAREILGMFYQHSRIFYGALDSEYVAIPIREIVEKVEFKDADLSDVARMALSHRAKEAGA